MNKKKVHLMMWCVLVGAYIKMWPSKSHVHLHTDDDTIEIERAKDREYEFTRIKSTIW